MTITKANRTHNFLKWLCFRIFFTFAEISQKWVINHYPEHCTIYLLNLNGHEAGRIYPPIIFRLNFVSWIFIKNFQKLFEVKFGCSEKATTFEKIFHLKYNATLELYRGDWSFVAFSEYLNFKNWDQSGEFDTLPSSLSLIKLAPLWH